MRKAVNILQTIYFTYDKITLTNVNKIINKPEKKIIENIIQLVFEKNFESLIEVVSNIINNYSSFDIIHAIFNVIKDYNMENELKLKFIKELGQSEVYLLQGADAEIQLTSLLANMCLLIWSLYLESNKDPWLYI